MDWALAFTIVGVSFMFAWVLITVIKSSSSFSSIDERYRKELSKSYKNNSPSNFVWKEKKTYYKPNDNE